MKKLLFILIYLPMIVFGQDALENCNELVAEYSYSEQGDYAYIVFTALDGKEWDFGAGNNNFGSFDFEGENFEGNKELVGKRFKIYWINKKVEAYAEDGETVIQIEALSVIKIELLKQ
tara:strand:+ start:94 stop:447 length:354 start_codon:yes stop_codon:yes gene_type:complete